MDRLDELAGHLVRVFTPANVFVGVLMAAYRTSDGALHHLEMELRAIEGNSVVVGDGRTTFYVPGHAVCGVMEA